MKDRQIITRKVQLRAVGDREETGRIYRYISDGQYAQNRAYNILISNIYAAIISGKQIEDINDLYKRGARRPKKDDPNYSLYPYGEMEFPKGLATANNVANAVRQDIKTATSRGLFKGKSSLPNKRLDAPLSIDARFMNFYHRYGRTKSLEEGLEENSPQVYMRFVDKITFQIVFGNQRKSAELRQIFRYIFDGSYKVCQSSIQLDPTGKKIMLNLVLSIPTSEISLKEDMVVGVHFGYSAPIVCSLIDGSATAVIGDADDFIKNRERILEQKNRLQNCLKYTSGGHGRAKKFKKMSAYSRYQKNYAATYNHYLSRQIVDFAVKHHAKYINLENIAGQVTDEFVLQRWSYWQLESDLTYKAAQFGIELRTVSPEMVILHRKKWEEDLNAFDTQISLEIAGKTTDEREKSRRVSYST